MRMSGLFGCTALAVAPLVVPVAGAGVAIAQPADLQARADAILNGSYPADGPGAAVIIMRRGQVIYRGGRGLADIGTHRPITPATVFRLGSLTKQFTAAVILQLVAEGRLSLEDPISKFFPDYPRPGATATVRQLLNHTSGIQSYTDIPGFMTEANTNRAHSTAEMIALFRDLPSPTPPGQAWAYNNSGYVMLGAIIERVTGKSWHQAVAERITGPLGLRTIGYGVDREGGAAMAHGYSEDDGHVAPARLIHMSVPHAAGGLVGTVGDLARWSQALHHGRVVRPDLYRLMTSPTPMPDGHSEPYGFGLQTGHLRGREVIEHSGGIFGFSTYATYIPSEDLFVAVFANSDQAASSPGSVDYRLAALALGDPYPAFTRMQADMAALAPLFGVYRIGDGTASRRFFARDGKLFTLREGGRELEVFAAGEDRFFYGPNSLTWFRIVRQSGGPPAMEMHQDGSDTVERAVRTGDIPPEPVAATVSRAVLQSYVGHYQTQGPAADIALGDNGVLTVQLSGQPAIPMRAVSDTEFVVQGVGARIVFQPENGRVDRFTIHQGERQIEARRTP